MENQNQDNRLIAGLLMCGGFILIVVGAIFLPFYVYQNQDIEEEMKSIALVPEILAVIGAADLFKRSRRAGDSTEGGQDA